MFPELLALAIPVDAGVAERTWRGHHPAPPPEEDDDDDDDDVKPGPGGGNIDPDDDEGVEDDDDDDDDTLWTGRDATLSSQTAEASIEVGRCRRKDSALGVQGRCKMRFRPLVRQPVEVAA
jgi:hypothetical protein